MVNDTPKIDLEESCTSNHTIQDLESGIQTQLRLDGIFSVFDTRALTAVVMNELECYPTVFLAPNSHTYNEIHTTSPAQNMGHRFWTAGEIGCFQDSQLSTAL